MPADVEELERQNPRSPDCLLLSGGVFANAFLFSFFLFLFFFSLNTDGMAAAGAYHNLSPKNNNKEKKKKKQPQNKNPLLPRSLYKNRFVQFTSLALSQNAFFFFVQLSVDI